MATAGAIATFALRPAKVHQATPPPWLVTTTVASGVNNGNRSRASSSCVRARCGNRN
jgi:hypothetical protein